MPSLSSLIVQRQVATVLEVEQAIARQVIHGGDLVTNLLEVAPACEPGLNAVLGESVGLPPAPWGRLPAPESDVLDLIPAELCLAHGFFPIRAERQSIVIATPMPLTPSVEDSLRFSLARGLTQIAAPTIRVREGIAAHYGIPLDARQLRLVQKLDEAARARGRSATSMPPAHAGEETAPLSLPRPPSMIPSTFESGVPSEEPDVASWEALPAPRPVNLEVTATPSPSPSFGDTHDDDDELEDENHEGDEHEDEPEDDASNQEDEREGHEPVVDEASHDDARSAIVPPVVEVPSRPPPRAEEILPPRAPVMPSSVPPSAPYASKPTLFDPIAQERADAMGQPPSTRFDRNDHAEVSDEEPVERHMRDTVPTPIDALDAMEAALLNPAGRRDLLHPDALTRKAPDVVSFDDSESAPSTDPRDEPDSFVSEPPPAVVLAPQSGGVVDVLPAAARAAQLEPEAAPPTTRQTAELAAELASEARAHDARQAPSTPPRAPELEDSPPPPSILNPRAVHRLLRSELLEKKRGKTARRKGPFARADAEKELEGASSAEELVDIFFAFVSQFFEYSALFLVHGDIAEGRDAFGPGAEREKVLGIGVPLDLPSSFAKARTEGVVVFSRMNDEDLDKELRKDLSRGKNARAAQVAIVPVTLRSRAVALLYGDDGNNDVSVSQLGDILGFTALASANLERIALSKKRGQVPSKRRAEPTNVAALARAFSLPGAEGVRPSQPPAAGVSPGARSVEPPPMPDVPPHELPSHALRASAASAAFAATLDAASVGPLAVQVSPPAARTGSTRPSAVGDEPVTPSAIEREVVAARNDVTRNYDDAAFGPRKGEPGRIAAAAPVDPATLLGPGPVSDSERRIVELPHQGAYLGPRESEPPMPLGATALPRTAGHKPPSTPPLRREEDDDASTFIAEQLGTPAPPRTTARRAEYAIIPDRAHTPGDVHAETQRARDSALYGPYGPLLMKATLGGIQAEEALAELEREAEHSLPKLVAVFPGPLLVDRFRLRDQLPPASECGPLLRLLVMLRRHALGFMTVRSTSPDVEQRFWATHVLGDLIYPEAAPAVLPRLFDDDVMVRRVARRAATALVNAGAAGEPLKRSLENMIKSQDEPIHRRVLAIEAMGEIRAAQMIPVLVETLSDASDDVVEAARCSLMLIARQDLGVNVKSWEAWWLLNRHKHRIEWLIDALTHDTASVRRAAGDELKQITKEYFGYYDDLPPRERERAQQKYREWWADEGQFRFR